MFFFQAEDGIRDSGVTGVQTCALPIYGGDGAVTVHTSAINETRITRVVQSHDSDVGPSYRLDGTVLHVDTTCGFRCTDRKSVVSGKSVDLGGRRIIKKQKTICNLSQTI